MTTSTLSEGYYTYTSSLSSYWCYVHPIKSSSDNRQVTPVKSLKWNKSLIKHPLHKEYCQKKIETILLTALRLRQDVFSGRTQQIGLGDVPSHLLIHLLPSSIHTLPELYNPNNQKEDNVLEEMNMKLIDALMYHEHCCYASDDAYITYNKCCIEGEGIVDAKNTFLFLLHQRNQSYYQYQIINSQLLAYSDAIEYERIINEVN